MFITIGPYQATGSWSGLAGDEQEADAVFAGLHGDFVAAVEQDQRAVVGLPWEATVSSHPTPSVGTASGAEALQNLPLPAKT